VGLGGEPPLATSRDPTTPALITVARLLEAQPAARRSLLLSLMLRFLPENAAGGGGKARVVSVTTGPTTERELAARSTKEII